MKPTSVSFNLTRVKNGTSPDTVDRVSIDLDRGGFYSWKGLIFVEGHLLFGGSPPEFRTADEAEIDAVSWARARGVIRLFVEDSGDATARHE